MSIWETTIYNNIRMPVEIKDITVNCASRENHVKRASREYHVTRHEKTTEMFNVNFSWGTIAYVKRLDGQKITHDDFCYIVP